MLYGVSTFLPDYSIPPDEFARLLEERGFESMWMPEHIHTPASQRPQLPGGADLPKEYWHSYDPFNRPYRGGYGHHPPEIGDVHLPDYPARSDNHR